MNSLIGKKVWWKFTLTPNALWIVEDEVKRNKILTLKCRRCDGKYEDQKPPFQLYPTPENVTPYNEEQTVISWNSSRGKLFIKIDGLWISHTKLNRGQKRRLTRGQLRQINKIRKNG